MVKRSANDKTTIRYNLVSLRCYRCRKTFDIEVPESNIADTMEFECPFCSELVRYYPFPKNS